MIYWIAKVLRFISFVAMVLFGVMSVPRIIFLILLPFNDTSMPAFVIRDVLMGFLYFIISGIVCLALTSWIQKRDEVFF